MVSNSDLNASAYYARMDLIQAWLSHHHLPLQLKKTLHRYFKAYLSERSAISEAEIWDDLSPELQKEVGHYLLHESVKTNPLFDGLGIGCVVRLQSILQKVTVLRGRQVITKGETGTAMYIILSGMCQIEKHGEDTVVSKLGPGQ